MGRQGLSSSISITNGCDVDQGTIGDRGSIGGKEWSVITPLIRLYTASGYCLPRDKTVNEQKKKRNQVTNLALIRFSRDNAASIFPTPSSARTITSHVDGY